jgi:hypothetical protein
VSPFLDLAGAFFLDFSSSDILFLLSSSVSSLSMHLTTSITISLFSSEADGFPT